MLFGIIVTLKYSIKNESQHFKNILVAVLATLCLTYQYWELSNAAITLPYKLQQDFYRWECLYSTKGGKRPYGETAEIFKNPCYSRIWNESCATRNEHNESKYVNNSSLQKESMIVLNNSINNGCDANLALNLNYLDDRRDCEYGKRGSCTKNSPCVPCGLKHRRDFGDRWKRCQSCNGRNSCNFVEGIGPYCYKSATSRKVIPCVECCTDPAPDISTNGTCY